MNSYCYALYYLNAFSEKLSPLGFNVFLMLAIDLLHEFKLGIWKAIFTHLIRILMAHSTGSIQTLNHR